jgi:hypothetical protein
MVLTRAQAAKHSAQNNNPGIRPGNKTRVQLAPYLSPIQTGWTLGQLTDKTTVRITGWSYIDLIESGPFRGGGTLMTTPEFTVERIELLDSSPKRLKLSEARLFSGEYVTYGMNSFASHITFFSTECKNNNT